MMGQKEKTTYLEKDERKSIYDSLNVHMAYETLNIYWIEKQLLICDIRFGPMFPSVQEAQIKSVAAYWASYNCGQV